jgi:hypothetical protein
MTSRVSRSVYWWRCEDCGTTWTYRGTPRRCDICGGSMTRTERATVVKTIQHRRESALLDYGECSWCKNRRVLVTCPCRACDRLEASGKLRWRVCRKCALKLG